MTTTPISHTQRFETVGDLYYRDTGHLRPGKSYPLGSGRDSCSPENRERFEQWLTSRFFGCAIDRIASLETQAEEATGRVTRLEELVSELGKCDGCHGTPRDPNSDITCGSCGGTGLVEAAREALSRG